MMRIYIPFMQMSILLAVKSNISLIYLRWETYETLNVTRDGNLGYLHMLMVLVSYLIPTRQLLK